MTKVSENTSEKGEKQEHTVQILDYSGIFLANDIPNKRIYILGDVGSGKTAFCKMMMTNWCLSSGVQYESAEEDVRILEKFELLFYLPLRTFNAEDSLLKMITWYYRDICTEDDLLNVLQLIPERCLVIADGIDEWKPKTVERRRAHETHGLPTTEKMDHVTIVTTSRPSAQGILNMKKSYYDVKIRLDGIREQDVETLIENLYPKSHSEDGLRKLRDVPIKDLEKTPFLLQQIVWLQQRNIDIGKSISEVYSNVVNIAFRWNQKDTEKTVFGQTPSVASTFTELSFPDQIKNNYPEFISHSSVIFGLGKMAFEIMTQGSEFSFGTIELNKNGIDEYLRTEMLGTGLLTEEVRFDNSKENTQFYFTHTSFLEYFAALYIASHREKDKTSGSDSSTCHKSIFDILMERCHSIQDVIRLENMLVIVCGFVPSLTYNVCTLKLNHIYEQNEILYPDYKPYKLEDLSLQSIDLAYRCVRECKLNDPNFNPKIPYYAVYPENKWDRNLEKTKEVLQYVDPLTVRCLVFSKYYPVAEPTAFQKLRVLQIIFVSEFPTRNQLSSLAEYITQTRTLRSISLIPQRFVYYNRNNQSSMIYKIDLSKHEQLQSLVLEGLRDIRVNFINTVNLNHCIIKGTAFSFSSTHAEKLINLEIDDIVFKHNEILGVTKFINGSVLLETIKISKVRCSEHQKGCSHLLDILHLSQLQTLNIRMFQDVRLHKTDSSFSSRESTKLSHIVIANCTLRCDELAMLITDSVVLRELDIKDIRCSVHTGCKNAIDLSRHNHLEVLEGRGVHFSEISTLNLKRCELSEIVTSFSLTDKSNQCQLCLSSFSLRHDDLSELTNFITRSVSVRKIMLNEIKCLDHKKCSHKIDLSQCTQLVELNVYKSFSCNKLNTSNLIDCTTDYTEVLHCLRDSVNLWRLHLQSLSYNKEVHDCVLTLPKLHKLFLFCMSIEDGVLMLTPEMKCLKAVFLCDVYMSESSLLQFLESLLALNWYVRGEVDTRELLFETVQNFVSKNKTNFQITNRRHRNLKNTLSNYFRIIY